MKTLKLDSTFRPIEVIDSLEALVLCIIGKAKAIENYTQKINSTSQTFELPAVIVLNRLVKYRTAIVSPTRKHILCRDDNICQYCGNRFSDKELTLDHVLPKSRGGNNSWNNLVAACRKCNQKKSNRTPKESGMDLLRTPAPPRYSSLRYVSNSQINDIWKNYLW